MPGGDRGCRHALDGPAAGDGIFAATSNAVESAVVAGQRKNIIQAWVTPHRWRLRKSSSASGNSSSFFSMNGLPWVLVFDGLPDASGKRIPMTARWSCWADFCSAFDRNQLLFRDVYGLQMRTSDPLKKQLAAATDAGRHKEPHQATDHRDDLKDGTMTMAMARQFGMKDLRQ